MIMRKLLICSILLFSLPSMANDLNQQREIYKKLQEVVALSQSENSQQLAQQMLKQLKGYPLYPYAQFLVLNQNIANTDFANLLEYQQNYPYLPFANQLKENWLTWHLNEKNWQTILQQASKMSKNQFNQCLLILAEWQQKKLSQQSDAILPQQSIEKLWLTVNDKPMPSCTELFAEWNMQGGISSQLIKQRAILSFEKQNLTALSDLLSYEIQDESTLSLIKMLIDLLNTPQNLKNYPQLISLKNANPAPIYARILNAIMPNYINTLKENDSLQPEQDLSQFQQWIEFWQLPQIKLDQWKQLYLSHFFDVKQPTFQKWRDQQLQSLKIDKLTKRRIRMAIREKQTLTPWLNLLSEQAKKKQEWQYWSAQYDQAEIKQQKLERLSKTRGFYGLMAAYQLNKVYQPPINSLTKRTTTTTEIVQKSAQHLLRISELMVLGNSTDAYQEWLNLLKPITSEQRLALADYALQNNWYELAVEATIQAKAWGYLSLRLPNAYLPLFDLHLANKKIQRTFAMAIARQESAWQPEAVSNANARGLMQILPTTAQQTAEQAQLPYMEDFLFKPFYNIMLGTTHLQQLYDKYGDNRILIAAAYNAGANRVDRWLKRSRGKLNMAEFIASIPFLETRNYVQNVIAYDAYYQILQQQPQHLFSKQETNRLY